MKNCSIKSPVIFQFFGLFIRIFRQKGVFKTSLRLQDHLLLLCVMMTMNPISQAQDNPSYQMPPQDIAGLVDADPTPQASLSPNGGVLLLLQRPNLPSIEEVAQKELRLAGIRINPKTNGSSRASYYNGMKIKSLATKTEKQVSGLPQAARIENVSWSPDGSKIVFTITQNNGLELWMVDTEVAKARRLTEAVVNDAISGLPFRWFSDSQHVLYKSVLTDRGRAPEEETIQSGPVVQENKGSSAPVRTYQDLLKNSYDEQLFEYFTTSQLMLINLETGKVQKFGKADIIAAFSTSPDGNYVRVASIKKPFSYIVPYGRFGQSIAIYDKAGQVVKQLPDLPVAENIPKGFGAVREGARSFSWRSDAPATLTWVEAQDGGDPKREAEVRDQLFSWAAPFEGSPKKGIAFQLRFSGIDWGSGELAMAYEWWWPNRQVITSRWEPDHPEKGKTIIFDRSWEDRYNSPGSFEMHLNEYGRSVLMTANEGQTLFLMGQGASPEGNRPFVDQYDLANQTSQRLWRSKAPHYEVPIAILDEKKAIVLTRREANDEVPNYFLRHLLKDQSEQITFFDNPYEKLKAVKKELVKYQRADGVELTGTLYLPPAYDKERDGRLPVLMWAYPREYKSADAAGQVKDSPYEFIRLSWFSPIFWVMEGYAVFDDFGVPIVGEGEQEPNETFVEQLVADAEAA
ncbi:MAG: S9 family peptidase, partial [Bacteroidota bacterium]